MSIPKMNFGQFKNQPVSQVPEGYLEWALRECVNVGQRMRRAIEDELDRRFAASGAEVTTPIPAGQMENLIRQWHREMSLRFHPDRDGSTEAQKAINLGAERLRELAREICA